MNFGNRLGMPPSINEVLAYNTQRYNISKMQRLKAELSGHEGFIFDPQLDEDRVNLLPGQFCNIPVQDVQAELEKLSQDSRRRILEFVDGWGDYTTFVHDLAYVSEYNARKYFFIIKHYPSPDLTPSALEQIYNQAMPLEHDHPSPSEPLLRGALVLLPDPWTSSAFQRWNPQRDRGTHPGAVMEYAQQSITMEE
jgi:hypothetical protein